MPGKLCRIAAIPAVAALFSTCGTKPAPVQPALQTVTAGVVERIQPESTERYAASIEPFARVDLAFPSSGTVERLLDVRGADGRMRGVQAGDRVEKGAELAQVSRRDYQHRLDETRAQSAQSRAQLAQAQAQLAQARANFSVAEIEYQRADRLLQSASLVKPQFDQAKGRFEASAAAVAAEEAAVKAAEVAVTRADAAVEEAELSLGDTSLRAPSAGWISARNIDRGSVVGSGTVAFTMIDTHVVKAVFAVPDSVLPFIRLGQRQAITLDTLQHTVSGVITSISPQADPKSRVFAVEATGSPAGICQNSNRIRWLHSRSDQERSSGIPLADSVAHQFNGGSSA